MAFRDLPSVPHNGRGEYKDDVTAFSRATGRGNASLLMSKIEPINSLGQRPSDAKGQSSGLALGALGAD